MPLSTTGIFMSMDQASAIAVDAFGDDARVWDYSMRSHLVDNDPSKFCQVGLGGAGRSHQILGTGPTWAEALRNAKLL